MRSTLFVLMLLTSSALVVSCGGPVAPDDESSVPVALTGQVTSAAEGPMEGVLVTARKAGSTVAITVVSDQEGRYGFPQSRLEPGQYSLSIRAVGYDLEAGDSADVIADNTTQLDLTLRETNDLASQLTNTEWLHSFPGTDEQKASIRACAHCHTLELATRSTYNEDEWVAVVARMATYPPLAMPLMPQVRPADRIGGGVPVPEEVQASLERRAAYLGELNLSSSPEWTYPLVTLPRPTGRATRVIYTEYDLPEATRQPHDVIVDSEGMAWYASFGEQILGKLDPRTGEVTEYEIPLLKPDAPTGILGMRFDGDENPWLAMQFQGGIAKFDKTTETFQTWSLPPEHNGPHVQINQLSPGQSHIDGKVWFQDAGTWRVFRLDIASGTFDVFEPYEIPRPNVYDVLADSENNGYFLTMGAGDIGKIDAKTGEITIYNTPTPNSGPRRGRIDSEDRVWFGENRADKIGMFDPRTESFEEWAPPTPGAWPYDVTPDKNGEVWAGGEYNDRVLRLDPETGEIVEYLLPKQTNIRRVFVDNSTTPVTFWVGSNHGASIVKLEPLD